MNNSLSEIQIVLLDTFKAFARFCKQNDIQYFATSGTLLGAIRHKGFIPWDDDIDVFLLRKDYDKLLALKKDMQDTEYMVADFHDRGYPYEFAKFYDKTKTFWEYKQFPFLIGPFIDLFPLDESQINDNEQERLYKKLHAAFWVYRKCISHQTWGEIATDLVHLNGLEWAIKFAKKIFYTPQSKYRYKKLCNQYEDIKKIKGDFYKPYWDVKHIQYPKSWFEEAITVPFEDTTIKVPNGYDEILTYIYDDYMTPPSEHNRTGHHTAYYMNLKERLEIDEILRLKKNELIPKSPMSVNIILDEIKHWRGFD